MFISLNPDTIGLENAEFAELLSLAPGCGFQGIDFPMRSVQSRRQARDLKRAVDDAGMQWGLFSLPCDFLNADGAAFERGLAELGAILPVVEAAGCTRAYNHIWPGNNERNFEENFAWHVGRLQKLCTVLEPAGVRLGVEFIGPKTLQNSFRYPFIRDAANTVALIERVGHGLGIVVDCFHWYTSGSSLQDLGRALAERYVVNVHVNDATAGRTRDEQMDLERRMPLETGLVDAPGVLRLLGQLGYDGPVIAEPFNPHRARFARMPPRDVLAEVGTCMRQLFNAAGVGAVTPKPQDRE